jgi:hypothetical protein
MVGRIKPQHCELFHITNQNFGNFGGASSGLTCDIFHNIIFMLKKSYPIFNRAGRMTYAGQIKLSELFHKCLLLRNKDFFLPI